MFRQGADDGERVFHLAEKDGAQPLAALAVKLLGQGGLAQVPVNDQDALADVGKGHGEVGGDERFPSPCMVEVRRMTCPWFRVTGSMESALWHRIWKYSEMTECSSVNMRATCRCSFLVMAGSSATTGRCVTAFRSFLFFILC